MSDDAILIELLSIRNQIAECRRQRLWVTAAGLREKAMSLAECFVDPAWAAEAAEQRQADRISVETRLACRADAQAIDPVCGF